MTLRISVLEKALFALKKAALCWQKSLAALSAEGPSAPREHSLPVTELFLKPLQERKYKKTGQGKGKV